MDFKPQFKLTFTELHTEFDDQARSNVQVEKTLMVEWAEIEAIDPLEIINGVQANELATTHLATVRFLSKIQRDMKCHRMTKMPDRSLIRENFRVLSYQPLAQDNRYMRVQLSLDTSTDD